MVVVVVAVVLIRRIFFWGSDEVRFGHVCLVLQHDDDGSRRDDDADSEDRCRVQQQQRDIGLRQQQLLRRSVRPAGLRKLRPTCRKLRPSSAAALLSLPKPKRRRPRPAAGHAADQPGLPAPAPASSQLQERRLLLNDNDFARFFVPAGDCDFLAGNQIQRTFLML